MRTIQKIISGFVFLLSALLPSSCILDTDYEALPFDGKVMPRITGYNGVSQATNDWMYFNLRTGEIFNLNFAGENIKEGEQKGRLDWDIAFCGYHLRTNGGTSGKGKGAVADLGYGNYEKWRLTSKSPWNYPVSIDDILALSWLTFDIKMLLLHYEQTNIL